jgi:SAM-dependent methyltransferase
MAACAHPPDGPGRHAHSSVVTSANAAAPAPPRALAVASDADVKAWSHAIIDAYDRGEVTPLEVALSPQFVHFEDGQSSSREEVLNRLRVRTPEDARIGSRTWEQEEVVSGPQGAVFVGKAIEHSVGNETHGGDEYVGFYELVWAPAGERYQVVLWSWQLGGRAVTRAFWDERYRHGTGFNKEPNQLLIEMSAKQKPGLALDLAMGQGRNALYLAEQGWQVTGVDFSSEATRQAEEQAAARDLELDILQQDIDTFDFGVGKWDLVTMIYATDNVDWIARSQRSLKRGGLFVYEFFQDEGKGVDSVRLAAMFRDGFEIVRNDVVRSTPDWARNAATLVRFVARKR